MSTFFYLALWGTAWSCRASCFNFSEQGAFHWGKTTWSHRSRTESYGPPSLLAMTDLNSQGTSWSSFETRYALTLCPKATGHLSLTVCHMLPFHFKPLLNFHLRTHHSGSLVSTEASVLRLHAFCQELLGLLPNFQLKLVQIRTNDGLWFSNHL